MRDKREGCHPELVSGSCEKETRFRIRQPADRNDNAEGKRYRVWEGESDVICFLLYCHSRENGNPAPHPLLKERCGL